MKIFIIFLGLIFLSYFSCNEKSVNWEVDTTFSYRSSKCMTAYSLSSSMDSSFVYSFDDSLVIDFSVRANCCPDSDRFNVSYVFEEDTIINTVVDTAQNVCYCTCPYIIHEVFKNLPGNHYVVRCKLDNYKGTFDPIYLVDVYRKE
jgi:hypothetical protein